MINLELLRTYYLVAFTSAIFYCYLAAIHFSVTNIFIPTILPIELHF